MVLAVVGCMDVACAIAQTIDVARLQKALTDDDLKDLPNELQELTLRGNRGYGIDSVTDAGITHLARYKGLRKLRAGGLGLTDRCFDAIAELSQLEELSLDSNLITGSGLKKLSGLKRLRKLDLNFNPLVEPAFEHLSQLSNLTALEAACSLPVSDRMLEQCARLRHLESLHLSNSTSGVTDRGLAALSELSQLKNLALNEARVSDQALRRVGNLERLESLKLSNLHQTTAGNLAWIAQLPNLRLLEIAQVRLNQLDLAAINRLSKLERLLLWNVLSSELGKAQVERLDGLTALRELRTNEELATSAIEDLTKLRSLESITDELVNVTDEHIAQFANLPKLHTLCLGSKRITERSLTALARMSALRSLFVTREVSLSDQQLTELGRSALPHCQIQLLYPPYTVYHSGSAIADTAR